MDAVTPPTRALAVARVDLRTGGTAFAVSDRLVLTAFHVVGDRVTGTVTHPDVQLLFGGGSVAASVDSSSDPDSDAALLHLHEALPAGSTPIRLTSEVGRDPWFSRGFPVDDPTATGLTVDGNVVDPDQRQPQTGSSVIALYCRQAAAGSPQRLTGFSGAPVLIGELASAVGLIRWNPTNPSQPGIAAGGTVYACPVRSIFTRWPELRDLAPAPVKPPLDAEQVEHLRRLITQQERNLRITETQLSEYASSEQPLRLINQRDSINNELRILRERLGLASGQQVT
jgi:Trypsin-like peptidase domain